MSRAQPPSVAGADVDAVLALEAVAARSWPAPDTQFVDGWLLRAAGGFTGRANSALPLTPEAVEAASGTTVEMPAVLDGIHAWYAQRGLPTLIALPLPLLADLHGRLLSQGWRARGPTLVLTAAVDQVLAACGPSDDMPPAHVRDVLDGEWLRLYGRAEALRAPGRNVVAGGGARFATLHLDDQPAAIARWTVDGPWVGLTAVQVVPSHRRRGLATYLAAVVMRDALGRAATRAWLQVEGDNEPAIALYRRLGFEVHHEYWYDRCPDDGEQP